MESTALENFFVRKGASADMCTTHRPVSLSSIACLFSAGKRIWKVDQNVRLQIGSEGQKSSVSIDIEFYDVDLCQQQHLIEEVSQTI